MGVKMSSDITPHQLLQEEKKEEQQQEEEEG